MSIYTALAFPQGYVVAEGNTVVADGFTDWAEAQQHAQHLNDWRARMPQPSGVYRPWTLPEEPTVERLFEILDRPLELEVRCDGLEAAVARAVGHRRELLAA